MNNVQQQKPQSAGPEAENDLPSVPPPETLNAPELEQLRTENAALHNSIRMRDAREELTRSLAEAGARSPELLFAAARDDLQFSDDGSLENTAAIVAHLKRRHPGQFGLQRPEASIDGGAGTLASPKMISAEGLSKMTAAEIQKLDWDEVRRVIGRR
ncbi:MAG: hypothetical protein ABIU09_07305 [Pyrinomonadaceae bacterium]